MRKFILLGRKKHGRKKLCKIERATLYMKVYKYSRVRLYKLQT